MLRDHILLVNGICVIPEHRRLIYPSFELILAKFSRSVPLLKCVRVRVLFSVGNITRIWSLIEMLVLSEWQAR